MVNAMNVIFEQLICQMLRLSKEVIKSKEKIFCTMSTIVSNFDTQKHHIAVIYQVSRKQVPECLCLCVLYLIVNVPKIWSLLHQ